jgi:threonine/homoserine/homoserine lactone efflux protein
MTAGFLLLVTPGPAVLYIVTRSLQEGRAAGLMSTLGLAVGGLGHVIAAAAGLSALLLTSALAFSTVKYLGAAYLIYLGVRTLLVRSPASGPSRTVRPRLRRAFRDGVIVNLLNPKAALFFLAFLPQFVSTERGTVGLQITLLGSIFILMGIVTDTVYALSAGTVSRALGHHPIIGPAQRYLTGAVYIGLGLAAATTGGKEG